MGFGEELPCGFVKTALASSILEYRYDLDRVDVIISPLQTEKCPSENCGAGVDAFETPCCSLITKLFDTLSDDGESSTALIRNDANGREVLSFQISKKGFSEEDIFGLPPKMFFY